MWRTYLHQRCSVACDVCNDPFGCSKKCQAVINMIAQKLGNEDAALYRFTHPAAQPTPAATPQPALSNTVIERDPSLHPSQRASGQHSPTSHVSAQRSMPQAESQQASQSSSQVSSPGGWVGAGTRKRSKAGLQYAAGNAKVPIMLAEIKVCNQGLRFSCVVSTGCIPFAYCSRLRPAEPSRNNCTQTDLQKPLPF